MLTPGFTPEELETLSTIQKDTLHQFTYGTDLQTHGVIDYWPTYKDVEKAVLHGGRFIEDCDGFSIVCMDKAVNAGFNTRLVVCYDELNEGHCICEVASADQTQAYYFDNRKKDITTASEEIGYRFIAVSPWNPQPGESREWDLVDIQPITA